jgi:transposase
MKRSTKYVGLDVHQSATVASVRQEDGRVIARSVLPTEEHALVEFFRGMRGSIHVAFEEGTQAQWLHDLLLPRADHVVVCHRRKEDRLANKGDQVDADELSQKLRRGGLRPVYHGSPHQAILRELTRTYQNVVDDGTRVKQRLKALFRARAIQAPGKRVYNPAHRQEWLAKLPDRGVRFRAEMLYTQLDVLRQMRPKVKDAMIAEARRDPAWAVLHTIPFFGPVRVSLLLATLRTPWRFRTKRNLWSYCGLAVVTRSSSDYAIVHGRPVRRRRGPMTRGLNRHHNRIVKNVFKGAATAATGRPGPLRDFYLDLLERGMREELARLTLARKLAALTLRIWKTGEPFDPTKAPARDVVLDRLRDPGHRCGWKSHGCRSPGPQSRRGTLRTLGPPAEPEQAPGRPRAESLIEPWFALRDRPACSIPLRSRQPTRAQPWPRRLSPPTHAQAPRHPNHRG